MLELRLAWQFISIIEGWLMKSSHHHGASCEVWFLFLSRASSGPAPYLSRGGRPWSWCSPSSRPVPGGTAWRSSGSGRRCRCLQVGPGDRGAHHPVSLLQSKSTTCYTDGLPYYRCYQCGTENAFSKLFMDSPLRHSPSQEKDGHS